MKTLKYYTDNQILPGEPIKVKTKSDIVGKEECRGFFVKEHHLDARKPNTIGFYNGFVPGAGGDVWWIKHEDGTVGAYGYWELTDVE